MVRSDIFSMAFGVSSQLMFFYLFLFSEYFTEDSNPNVENLHEAIGFLAGDRDKDVRSYFNPAAMNTDLYGSDGESVNDISVGLFVHFGRTKLNNIFNVLFQSLPV